MKNRAALLLLLSTLICSPSRSIAAAPLSENLKPLEAFLGNWDICWTDAEGQHRSGRASIRSEAAGAIVVFEAQFVDQKGKPSFSHFSLFYWDAESRAIVESSFDSSGWHGSSIFAEITASKFVLEGGGNRGPGTADCSITEFAKLCRDRWTLQFSNQFGGGAPASPAFGTRKLTFTRAH